MVKSVIGEMTLEERPDKNGFWDNELRSLGLVPKRKNELNDKVELQTFADIIKQAMYQDYKIAYSEKGDDHEQEAKATLGV
jgi:hypothetical protein